jgi:hypothetical protein
MGGASSATGYLLREERSVLSMLRSLGRRKVRLPPKRARAGKQSAKELIALLVAMVVLVGAGVAYAANTYPAHYSAIKGGDHPGKDDPLLAEGIDALLGRWLGDNEDPGEPAD